MSGLWSTLVGRALFPLHERVLGRPTFSYLGELERSQWLTHEEIVRLQMQKLKALLCVAQLHSPWHARRLQEAGVNPGAPDELGLNDLHKLPTMTRADARAHRDEIVWKSVPGGTFPYNTGGSSGQPLVFNIGRMRQASDAAGRIRARRWWDVEVGEPEVLLWGAPIELNKTDRIKHLRDRLFNQLLLNAFEMSPSVMDSYLDAIERFKPTCIYGYASSLALLATRALDQARRLRLPLLKVICTTGEPLYPHQREVITRAFGVPTASEFGSRDIGFTAHESPAGQMLLMSESVLVEVLDGNGEPCRPGETGEAVVTGLCSEAQPFIRYRTGDMVRMSGARCAQGRGLHVIDEVAGRSTDFVVRSDGTVMHALALIYVLRAVPGVSEFKIVQRAVDDVEVQIVQNSQWRPTDRDRIVAGLRARLGQMTRVDVTQLDRIAVEASGKHRYVVSQVPLPAGMHIEAAA